MLHSILSIGTQVFCFGGVSSIESGLVTEPSVEAWESTESLYFDNSWTLVEESLLSRMFAAVFPISPTEIMIYGGHTASNEQLSDIIVYNIANKTFRQAVC